MKPQRCLTLLILGLILVLGLPLSSEGAAQAMPLRPDGGRDLTYSSLAREALQPTNTHTAALRFVEQASLTAPRAGASDEAGPGPLCLPLIFGGIGQPEAPADMVLIPAGTFQMGCASSNDTCSSPELPLHRVNLSGYFIDKYEVTNARYAACVNDGGCTAPHESSSYTRDAYYGNPIYADYPVIHVDSSQAKAFCAWEGKRLPTDAEWEKAARGASAPIGLPLVYPWGDAPPTCDLVNGYVNGGCATDTAKVGSHPTGASPYGVMDMSGNVQEWVNDWFGSNYYCAGPAATTKAIWKWCSDDSPPYADPWSNPTGPAMGKYVVLRGGSWLFDHFSHLRTADRFWERQDYTDGTIGFRCVRSQ